MAHGASKGQLELVAVLGLIALFTHNHLFWIAALLLALIKLPDFASPMNSIANSLRKIAGQESKPSELASPEVPVTPTKPRPVQTEPQLTPVDLKPGDKVSERRG